MFGSKRDNERERSNAVASAMLAEVRADIVHADQKGALVLATVGLVFGVVLTAGFEGRLSIGGSWSGWDTATFSSLLWWAGVAAAALACFFAGSSVWPRYRSPAQTPKQLAYWGDVAWYSDFDKFESAWKGVAHSPEKRTASQLWQLSRIVTRKYVFIRRAIVSAAGAGVLLVFAVVLHAW